MALRYLCLGLLLPVALSMKLNGASDAPQLTLATIGAPQLTLATIGYNAQTVTEMEKVFSRSEETHEKSMEEISESITLPKAMKVLGNSPALKQITSLLTGANSLRAGKLNGFGGLDGARKLLNDMIHEAASKYDAEIMKCTAYYAEQCALMEVARGQISAANYVAATARALILDADYNIKACDLKIPITTQELKDHNLQCKTDLKALDKRLKIVMGDIAIMTMILEMSDCDAKLIQTQKMVMYRCEDQCTHEKYVSFDHEGLQKQVDQLRSPAAHELFGGLADMFDDDGDSDEQMSLIQEDPIPAEEPAVEPKKAPFNRKPIPMTAVPANPCTDPNLGAPSSGKRAGKCTLKQSPRCYKLQARFLQIQAGITDTRDDLLDQISKKEAACKETEISLETSIENDKSLLSSSQTKLAAATEKEANAGENGRQVNKENDGYNADLVKQMKQCSGNYVDFETEMCSLKKIRGDVFKKMKEGHKGFFQDCELSTWSPEECTAVCAGGEQKLSRSILQHPGPPKEPGSKCLPLSAKRNCNLHPCPVDCVLEAWGGWSKCSSDCGGGTTNRVRDVKTPMRYAGKPCEGTTEAKQCNVAACEKHCVLAAWTKWTTCSKDCDGGTKKRVRTISEPAEGSGTCAGLWHNSRLQYQPCAMRRCKVPPGANLKCNQTMDVVIVLDGTPKSGNAGWAAEVKAANALIDTFQGPGITAKPNFAVVYANGPRTWAGVSKCTGKSVEAVDMANDCHVKIASHFTEDIKLVKTVINGLEYQPGSKLLSLALMTVKDEFSLGRKDARSVVVVFMDGEPLSYRKTLLTSLAIRKKARLLYVPVTKFSPLKSLKKWASRRWQENIVPVKDEEGLADPATVTHIVADICPTEFPKLKNKKQ